MHDDRVLLERRLDRFVRGVCSPRCTAPGTRSLSSAGTSPRQAVTIYRAVVQDFRAGPCRRRLGAPPGPRPGSGSPARSPEGWWAPGTEAELLVDLGFTTDQ